SASAAARSLRAAGRRAWSGTRSRSAERAARRGARPGANALRRRRGPLRAHAVIPVPLHVHSRYSLMRGVPDVQTLVTRARDMGIDTLALTDTNGLYGLVFFLQAARAAGIRPIVGVEIDEGREARAVLLAKDRAGYAALCRRGPA